LRLAEIQYREGAIDLLDVLTFRQRSFQADRTLLSLRRAQIESRITLYLALGGAI
jgi:outer membrane protein TolC